MALSPQDGAELSLLMKNADTAMYHAKEMGKNNFQFYQAEMNARALERLELESDLRRALELGEFVLHYQPQFTGDGRRLTGAEALLRWQHPRRGLVPPSEFIPVLERSAWWPRSATGCWRKPASSCAAGTRPRCGCRRSR